MILPFPVGAVSSVRRPCLRTVVATARLNGSILKPARTVHTNLVLESEGAYNLHTSECELTCARIATLPRRRHSPIVISDTEDNADRRSRREPLESTVYNRQSPIIISDDEDDRTNRSRRDPPRPRSSKRQRSSVPVTIPICSAVIT